MTTPSTVPQSDRPASGTRPTRFTFQDAIDHGLDFLGNDATTAPAQRACKRAAIEAYRALVNIKTWTYLYAQSRLITSVAYETGTISYDHTGGAYERLLILTDGVWPDWSDEGGEVRIGTKLHRVDRRIDDTHLQLDATRNPGQDIDHDTHAITGATNNTPIVITSTAHGLTTGDEIIVEDVGGNVDANGTWVVTVVDPDAFSLDGSVGVDDYTEGGTWRLPPTTSYTILRDVYVLPADMIEQDTPLEEGNFGGLDYVHPSSMIWSDRLAVNSGIARFFTILGDDRYPGRLTARFSPHPDTVTAIDFIYHRRPRELVIASVTAGAATMAIGTQTVTGSGTAWTAGMVGSVLRLGTSLDVPTGPGGLHPAQFETVITAVVSATELRVSDPADQTYTAVKSEVSDPVDIEAGAMQTAYLRGIEKELVIGRRLSLEARPNSVVAYDMALREARAADSRSFQGKCMGGYRRHQLNPKYFPATFT